MIESEPRCAVNAIRAALDEECGEITCRYWENATCTASFEEPNSLGTDNCIKRLRAELAEVDKMLEAADTMAAQLEATNSALGVRLPNSVNAYRAAREAKS
jgi:hypothetical protein